MPGHHQGKRSSPVDSGFDIVRVYLKFFPHETGRMARYCGRAS